MGLLDIPEDAPKLAQILDSTTTTILETIKLGKSVCVHCRSGVSRSGSTVIATVMRMQAMGWDPSVKIPCTPLPKTATYGPVQPALKYVRSRRRVVRPNKGFMDVLNAAAAHIKSIPETTVSNQSLILHE